MKTKLAIAAAIIAVTIPSARAAEVQAQHVSPLYDGLYTITSITNEPEKPARCMGREGGKVGFIRVFSADDHKPGGPERTGCWALDGAGKKVVFNVYSQNTRKDVVFSYPVTDFVKLTSRAADPLVLASMEEPIGGGRMRVDLRSDNNGLCMTINSAMLEARVDVSVGGDVRSYRGCWMASKDQRDYVIVAYNEQDPKPLQLFLPAAKFHRN